MAPPRTAARLRRIAKHRFGAVKWGAVNQLGLEALTAFAEAEDRRLGLEPITPEEMEALNAEAPRRGKAEG